ncbi:RAP domain-containing, putative [Babesia ovis]|uniref:RAP domain-containing, putative n=1 Tax=Babesia ovis TaxID=5869 RepID=A0A9W5WVL7_BABOV|nr:RAP domain-containing, putative [Babesia ovis]
MYLQPGSAGIIAGNQLLALCRRGFAFRIVRVPKKNPEATKYHAIHEGLLTPEEIRKANRDSLMSVYTLLEAEDVRNRLDRDYINGLLERTLAISRALLPEDYARIYTRLRSFPKVPSGITTELNEGVRRISANFNQKQIAMLIKSYAALSSRSVTTINELVKTFNKGFTEAEVWQLRDISAALATLRVPVKTDVETFYKMAVARLPKYLKTISGDDIGLFVNAFSRQGVNQDEVLYFVDAHAKRLVMESSYRTVALLCNAFARAERHSRSLINAVKERLHTEVDEFLKKRSRGLGTIEVVNVTGKHTETIGKCDSGGKVSNDGQVGDTLGFSTTPEGNITHDNGTNVKMASDSKLPLNLIDVAMVFNAFTKMEEHDLDLLNAYIPWLNHNINSESPTLSLVLLSHSFSRAGVNNKELYIRMAHVLIQRVNTLNCQQLGLVALSYAKVGQHIPLLFLRLADEVIYRGTVALKFKRYEFDFQSLEQLMQGFSRVGFRDHRVYHVLTTLLKRRLKTAGVEDMNGEMIASMLTSMSPNRVDSFAPFITDVIMRTRETTAYSTTGICRVLTAFGKLKIAHNRIVESMLKEVKNRLNEFQIPVLINTLKALARLKKYDLVLIKESLKRCSMHLVHLTPMDISNLLSALNDFGYRNVPFLQKLILCIKHRMEEFDRYQMYIIFSRLAMLRTLDAELYRQLIPRLLLHQHEFNELQLADISMGYIYLLVHFDYLQREWHLQRIAQSLAEKRKQYMPINNQSDERGSHDKLQRDIENLGVVDKCEHNVEGLQESGLNNSTETRGEHLDRGLLDISSSKSYTMPDPATNLSGYGFKDGILDAMLSHFGTKLDVATVFKLQTVHLYLQHIRPDIYSKLSAKSLETLHRCSSVKFALAEYMLTSSSVHREISHLLNLIGTFHRNEVQFGPYLIDIVPETTLAYRVAIEYDGPTHFYAETTMRTAKSILKHEILENAGWKVIHIPHQEWAQLVSTKQKIIYLDIIRKQFQGQPTLASNPSQRMPDNMPQARQFSTSLKRKRRYLLKLNEDILKKQLEAMEQGPSENEQVVKQESNSATDKIADILCTMLMDGKSDIIDIDDGNTVTKDRSSSKQ